MTRAKPWMKVWCDARTDRKLNALNDLEYRIWMNLLLYSCDTEPRGVVDYAEPEVVALEVNVTPDELANAVGHMAKLRLVERDADGYLVFPAFELRQYDYPSDRPQATRERKRKSRANQKAE